MAVKAADILAAFDKKGGGEKPSADKVLSTFDGVKKKDASGSGSSASPSGTTPTQKTEQPLSTSGSGSNQNSDLKKSIFNGGDPIANAKESVYSNPVLGKYLNSKNFDVVLADKDRVSKNKKYGGGGDLEFWHDTESGSTEFPTPEKGKNVAEIYSDELKNDPKKLQGAVFRDAIHYLPGHDAKWDDLRNQLIAATPTKFFESFKKNTGDKRPLQDFINETGADALVRGAFGEDSEFGQSFRNEGKVEQHYNPKQREILAKMQDYLGVNSDGTGNRPHQSDLIKQLFTNNYKNNSVTPDDINAVNAGSDTQGIPPEQLAQGVNNKGKNLDAAANAQTKKIIQDNVQKLQTLNATLKTVEDKKLFIPEDDLNKLKAQRDQEKAVIQKQYDSEKKTIVPQLLNTIKSNFSGLNWDDIYENPDAAIPKSDAEKEFEKTQPENMRRKSPIQWNPKTHTITPESAQWINQQVDKVMNRKGNDAVNAAVSGDLDNKERTYADISKDVINYLNTVVPVEHAKKKYADDFYKAHPEIKGDDIKAQSEFNNFFSKENVSAATAYVNTWRDKEFMKTGQRYYSKEGIFNTNPEYEQISNKYAERVANGTMSDEIARKQIDREVQANPSLKKIKDNYDNEIKQINENASLQYQNYIINGLKKVDNRLQLRVYKDGGIGLAGINSPTNSKLQKEFEEGYAKIPAQVLGEQASEYEKQASEKAKRIGPFWASFGGSVNEMASAVSKMVFNKTGWGGDQARYYEAQETSSPQISQSQEAAKWNMKGIESLVDPKFWASSIGAQIPVIAGTAAIGAATEGEGVPAYINWLASAGLFTAQNGLSTYNRLLNSKDANGNMISEADASHFMAKDMEKNALPNFAMMMFTSGALFRAKNIVKPTIAKAALGGLKSAAMAQPFFTWQGDNSYANMKEATGGKADIWDYMQSPDFRDNLVNGMVVGGGLSLLHAPGAYIKGIRDWTTMIHNSEGEFKANSLYNVALQHEMGGGGNYFRDGLKMHLFNGVTTEEKQGYENVLQYSTNLDRNLKAANLDPKNVHDLYQAHNLALADLHDDLAEKNANNKSLSAIYKDKAKDYREQAKAASDGSAKYHYLVNDQGEPIFLSDNSFKALDKEGKIGDWIVNGTISDVRSSDDPKFSEKYKESQKGDVEAKPPYNPIIDEKDQSTIIDALRVAHSNGLVSGSFSGILDGHLDNPDAHKEIAETVISQAIDHPRIAQKMIGDEAWGKIRDIVNEHKELSAKEPMPGEDHQDAQPGESKPIEGSAEYKKNIRDDYFAKADFFTPEEKEKFATLDESGQDKMIGDKRAELSGKPDPKNIFEKAPNKEKIGFEDFRKQALSDLKNIKSSSFDWKIDNAQLSMADRQKGVQDIAEGKNTAAARKIEAFIKEMHDKGEVPMIRGNSKQLQRADFTFEQLGLIQDEIKGLEPHIEKWLRGESELTPEQEAIVNDNIDNLISDYETEQSTGENKQSTTETKGESSKAGSSTTGRKEGDGPKEVSISSPKIETDGKTEKTQEAEGQQGDDVEKEGAENIEGAAPPLEPPPPVVQRVPEESPKDEFVSVRKEKNKEIEGAKELFEKQKVIKWNDTYREALTNVHSMYPDKNLYDAMKARVGHFTAMLEGGHLFNPTSEDNAVFNVYKLETMRRMSQVQGFDSSDPIQQLAAQTEFASLQKDLLDVARVTNPGGEAGRAFNILQSEIANDLEHGLQIRRMEIAAAKGGKLTDAELESTAADWHKEQELLQKQHELELQRNEEKFNKVIDGLKKQLGKAPKEVKEPTAKKKQENRLSQKGKEAADWLRSGKIKGGTYSTIPGFPQAINLVIETLAQIVEKGSTLAEAISQYVKDNKIKDEEQFKTDLFSVFTKQEKKEDAYDKIADMAKNGGVTDVTNDMVSKNLIRDYVNSHIGLHDQENILETAFKGLKEILPDLEKPKFLEAYLKENEFKQPTSKELKDSESKAKTQLQSIAKLEEDIADLSGYKDIRQRSFPTERERSEYEKKLSDEKDAIIKERAEKKAKEEKEYRELESERNRQLKKVSELTDKKNKLEQGIRDKKVVSKNIDTPEIERLKEQVKEADKNLRDAEKEVSRINREADAKTAKITQYNYDIQRLKERGELQKRSKSKTPKEIDKDIQSKQQQLKDALRDMGIKTSSEDKYTKASYDQRATAHNERLENLSKDIEEKLNKGGLSPDTEKELRNLKGKIDASKIVLDPTSALSQERTLKGGNDLLKSIASEFRRTTIGDISKVGEINRSLQRAIDKFGSDKDESEQDIKLQRAKDKARTQKDEYARRLAAGEFEDHPIVELTKSDAELIKVERDRNKERQKFEDKRKEFEKKNQSWKKRLLDFTRAAIVAKLIMKPITMLRVGASAFLRPQLEAATKATFGKGFAALPFDTTKAITEQAKKGGESSSNRAIAKLYEAQYKQYGVDKIKDLYDKANDKYEKSDSEFQKAKGELNNIQDKDSQEYKDAAKKVSDLQAKKSDDLIGALSYSMYQFMAGSSIREAAEVFLHRSTELERQLGQFDREAFTKPDTSKSAKERMATAVDNLNYILNFVGRSHAALKNFSARASFASGFVARLEGYSNDGVDITRPEKLLEIAHESYIDWERGKYQESNWVTDTWNKITNNIEKASPEIAFLFRADVAITRVPVNMLREGLMEYTLGAFRGSIMAAREYYKAKGIVLADGYTPENDAQFKKELNEQLQRIDPKQAATIIRSFRKGGFGLGLYALAMVGKVAFGGWAHKGQTAEDKKKMEREQDTGVPEIKTSQIKIGDYTLPDWAAKVAEHTPAFAPLGYALGLAQVYQNNIIDGKTTPEAATNAVMAQIDHITGSIPQLDKIVLPLAAGTAKSVLPSGQWDDVDENGTPIKRKAFHVSDYFKYLSFGEAFGKDIHIGDKNNILSEYYYKQALQNQKYFRDAITEVETNTGLSKEDKEQQRTDYLNQMKESEEEIYKQNKENPQ